MKITPLSLLLATTFLSTLAMAQTTPTINTDYLNSLTSDTVSLQKVDVAGENTIEIDGIYYKYIYNNTNNYAETSNRINDTLATSDVTDILFSGISSDADGGAIYNTQDNSTIIITADFINNYANSFGGAIYNRETIGDIAGDFIGNYASSGGAICNSSLRCGGSGGISSPSTDLIKTSIGNITGDFIGNYAYSGGGAIHNFAAESYYDTVITSIDNITGDFIGNSSSTLGGAIYNKADSYATAKFGNINGNFVGNSAIGDGGAIYNVAYSSATASFGNITGDFIGNSASNRGGAICNGVTYGYVNGDNSSFDNITGDFIGNYASGAAGAIENNGTIVNITGDFVANYAGFAGAIINTGSIGNITGDFAGNYASRSGVGAIYNHGGTIGDIIGNFIGNYASTDSGAIQNRAGTIGGITGDFVGNYVTSSGQAYGGAIYNMSEIGSIKSQNISENKAISTDDLAMGGFLYSEVSGTIKNISGNIYNNQAQGKDASGGAIFAYTSPHISKYSITIDNNPNYVIGPAYIIQDEEYVKTQSFNGINFDNNKAIALGGNAIGGAIVFGSSVTLGENVSSDEIKDAEGNIYGPDGNILTLEEFVKLYTDFILQEDGVYATYEEALASIGGVEKKSFEITNVTFTNNISQADNGLAIGGAVANIGGDGIITNSLFTNNKAIGKNALGGAIYNAGDLTIVADNYQSVFSGNMANDKDNAIYNGSKSVYNTTYDEDYEEIYEFTVIDEPSTLLLSAVNGGEIIFNDGIDGDKGYKLTVEGDGEVIVNSTIENVGELNINGGNLTISSAKSNQERRVVLSSISDKTASYSFNKINMVGGNLNFANLVIDEIKTSGLSSDNGTLHIDVDPVKMTSDKLSVDGNVEGTTKLVVHAASNNDLNGKIIFAESVNDSTGNEKSFEISRVYKSPYMYEVKHQSSAENEHEWYFGTGTEENPDYQPLGPIEVAPEVIATVAVKTAGLSQTNGMVYNIMRKVGVNRLFCPGCGFYDYNWDGEAFHNVWVDTTYNGLTIEAPVEIDAKVWGIEAGSDLQHDLNNKLGIFVSYRQGNYEMDGKGEKYYSNIGSEIDIDSYLAGLYYRYDRNNWYAFATLYGGMQNAEIQTDDGVANYDTDGIEFGGSIEGGYNYALTRTLSVTPSLGVFYSQISYDDATDNVGKTVEYNDLKQVELEAGAKFAHTQYTDNGFYSLYVKPSVVQTLIDGDEINITEIGKVDTVEDKTLGRVELGGNIGFNDNWSAYGWANYTFGSDYEATSLGLGLNYAW